MQPHKNVILWADAKELPGTKVLVYPKYVGNDFPLCLKILKGEQIVSRMLKMVKGTKSLRNTHIMSMYERLPEAEPQAGS